MAAFSRKDYQTVYDFARATFFKTRGKGIGLREIAADACRIMDLCEMAIGQQSDRPTGSLTAGSIKDRAEL